MKTFRAEITAVVLVCIIALYPALALALTNADFEQPVVGATGYAVFPTGAGVGWAFGPGDGTGVSGKQSAFTNGNPLTGNGQVAFIQNQGVFSQTVFLPAGQYVVTFSATQRMNYQAGTQTVSVAVSGSPVGAFTPTTGDLQNYATSTFNIFSDGNYSLTFQGTGSGSDYTAFLDNIAISQISPVAVGNDVSVGAPAGTQCHPALAQFNVEFTPASDPSFAGIWVRHMDHVGAHIISSNPGWYDASPNTLLGPYGQDCQRGPYASPTPPNDNYAQSTFQLLGSQAGFLML